MELQGWLAEGWQKRTEQKLAVAGCLAAALSLRSSPLRTISRLQEFAHKLVGYGGAALLFSGIQETSRAVRGRHDFLNSAVSGGITGAVVVGHYQGPQYRMLGLLTWSSVCAVLHLTNSLMQPRHLLEDYLIREGLLSPQVALMREAAAAAAAAAAGGQERGLQRFEHRDVLLDSLAIRDREMQQLNARLAAGKPAAAAAGAGATASAGAGAGEDLRVDDIADDDEGYLAWLRNNGFEADALLQPRGAEAAAAGATAEGSSSTSSSSGVSSKEGAKSAGGSGAGGSSGAEVAGAAAAEGAGRKRTWREWFSRWSWRRSKTGGSGSGGDGSAANGESQQ
ncbi:hypothetical protein Agub_g10000 [Astrephomene gubernaculifera]|uniref:Uncharacterized protein n=1 Tax=Astrephomene gubernaculifera TaxID=47775 RepID=A0AAD3DU33_9CHLO|nr:hypothetical protein Agub_g10000 [Astrephomene gubernaculifera]